ncbi:MAG: TolC family protein [Acidobacteria bacterium]|nr:TolC family protein [Acidobacteriota bacterium]
MRWFLWLCGLSSLALAQDVSAPEWTEARVLETFSRSSLGASLDARMAAIEAQGRGRALWANPSVNWSREGAGYTEFLQLEQALPITGRLRLLREAGRAATEVAGASRELALWDARSTLRLAFYQLLAGQQRQASITQTIQTLEDVAKILRVREKEGEGSRYDRLRADREMVQLHADLRLAEAQVAQLRAQVNAFLPTPLVGRAAGKLDDATAKLDAEAVAAQAMMARAELRVLDRTVAALKLEEQAAYKLRLPEPTLSAGMKRANVGTEPVGLLIDPVRGGTILPFPTVTAVGSQRQINDTSFVVGLSVPLPTFNKGQFEVARFTSEQRAAISQRQLVSQRIRAEVAGAVETWQIRRAALDAYRAEQQQTGGELLRIARVAYQEGELGILELLDAIRVERQALLRLVDLEAAVKEARIEIDRVVGAEVQP